MGLDHLRRRNNSKHWAWWTKNGWDLICTVKHATGSGRGMPAIPALETRGSGIQSHSQLHSEFMASLNYMICCLKTKHKLWSPFSGKYGTKREGTEIEVRSSCPNNQLCLINPCKLPHAEALGSRSSQGFWPQLDFR